MAGGPPVRGDLLTIWEPDVPPDPQARQDWARAARRIAMGLRELAHIAATGDEELYLLAFACGGDAAAAARWVQAIGSENVAARVLIDGAGSAGVQLPCRPDASDEEVRHVVLACFKAAHTQLGPALSPAVVAQLDMLHQAEQIIGGVAARLKSFGSGFRGELGHRLP